MLRVIKNGKPTTVPIWAAITSRITFYLYAGTGNGIIVVSIFAYGLFVADCSIKLCIFPSI